MPTKKTTKKVAQAAVTQACEKVAAAKTKPASLITFLLDRSGSMQSCRDATISAFNAYLSGLKEEQDATIALTFLQFDDQSLDKCCVNQPIATVPSLTHDTFVPRGMTPLIDAAMKTIRAVEGALSTRDDRPRVVVCIQTDGEENRSYQHSWEELSKLVAAKTAEGWEFNFMGAGIEGYNQSVRMGISVANTISYNSQDIGATQNAFYASASNARNFAAERTLNASYSDLQKSHSGDEHFAKWSKLTNATAK